MKRGKQFILIVSALMLLVVFMIGCNQQPQQPANQQQQGTTTPPPAVTPTAAATYVGSETCKQCHTDKFTAFSGTKHTQTFKPLSSYNFTQAPGAVTLFDGDAPEGSPKSASLDLSKALGVQMDDYLVASVPGFTDKYYRVAKLNKVGDKYELQAASSEDINKDGKDDWVAENYSCGSCHSPGLAAGSQELGFGCEACHGPGSEHAAAPMEKKKETMPLPTYTTCQNCHKDAPSTNKAGAVVTTNHYGVRDYSASGHAQGGQVNGCLTCHGPHKANANGRLLRADKPADICNTCHAGANFDPDKIMWKNPTDPYGHITSDHSFTAMPYNALGDDPKTKDIEITKQPMLDLVKKIWPDVIK